MTVREYIEAILGNCKEGCKDKFVNVYNTIEILFEKQEEALKTAKSEMDRRLEGMNEFRRQLDKQADTFMDKNEQKIINKSCADSINALQNIKSKLDGKMFVIILVIAAIVGALAGYLARTL